MTATSVSEPNDERQPCFDCNLEVRLPSIVDLIASIELSSTGSLR